MSNRSSQVEYSRYMRMIGEQEAPIKSRLYNFYNVDISLERLPDESFGVMQTGGITETIFEDIMVTALHRMWRNEYLSVKAWDIDTFTISESLYTIGGIATPNAGIRTEPTILLTLENFDISSHAHKPKIIIETYTPKITQIDNVDVALDSFSKFFETMNRMGK